MNGRASDPRGRPLAASAHPGSVGTSRQHQGCQAGHGEKNPLRHVVHLHRGRSRPDAAASGLPDGFRSARCPVVADRDVHVVRVAGRAGGSVGRPKPSRVRPVLLVTSPAHRSLCSCHVSVAAAPQRVHPAGRPADALSTRSVTLRHRTVTVQGTRVLSSGLRPPRYAFSTPATGATQDFSGPPSGRPAAAGRDTLWEVAPPDGGSAGSGYAPPTPHPRCDGGCRRMSAWRR
jgi:hypothetical protein